jgi:thiol-disulfide isomerase/thioredoxin/mono/diheme cytochrome c family protein
MSLRRLALLLLFGSLAALTGRLAGKAADRPAAAEVRLAGLRLTDPRDGKVVDFADLKGSKAVVVLFLGTECPINNAFLPVLAGLHKEYSPRGVRFLGVNSNRQDTSARVAEHARKQGVPFPVLKDPGNEAADRFGAQRTPEAFVLDGQGKVLYRGRIDDQFGNGYKRAGKPTRRDLAVALDEVLAGKRVSVPTTPVDGCRIARTTRPKTEGAVTYARHVSRILQSRCQECHRPGQIGPMSLLTYDDAVSWSETIREVISDGRMPPWHADPKYGKWSNDRRLSKADRDALLAWLDGGTPKGDDKDLPAPRAFPTGWQIGKPDAVFKMPKAFAVPAEAPRGGVAYRYFSVPTNFKEDRWVVRAEARPGAPEVVHHILVFIVPRGEVFRPDGPGNVLCGMAPGDMPLMLAPGFAKKLPAGARLIMQMHYTPNGKAQSDVSEVGVIFAKGPPKHRVLTNPIHNRRFMARWMHIPAGAENHALEASYTFRQDVHVLAFMPHMHLRGKDFVYTAAYPGGKKETLLSVPRYNFNWQSIYRAAEPVALPKGTRLHCLAHYDNSAKNPHNPDPTKDVYWGDQTWEEMLVGWIDYYVDDEKP